MSELQEVYVTAANRLAAVGGGRWRFGGGGRTGSPTCVPTLTECWGIGWGWCRPIISDTFSCFIKCFNMNEALVPWSFVNCPDWNCCLVLVWLRRCDTKCPLHMKSLGHRSHRNGRSAGMPFWWDLWWNRRLPLRRNALPQSVHTYGQSRGWVNMCSSNGSLAENTSEQMIQLYSAPGACWRTWRFRCSLRAKVRLQNSQACGDSPVWIRIWQVRCSLRVNVLGQKWHRCGDSPVCWRMWLVRFSFLVNDFMQNVHLCGDSPVCRLMWLTRWSLRVNAFGQYWHGNGVSPVCWRSW